MNSLHILSSYTVSVVQMFLFSSGLNSIYEDDETFDYEDEVFERRSPSLAQFTRSISAINSMSLGVQVREGVKKKKK